jgi:hypothetical protein
MIVSHHGLKGIGNKSTSNHKRHPPFREGFVSSPLIFAGISIVEFPTALRKRMWECRIAVYHHVPGESRSRALRIGESAHIRFLQ